MKRILPLFIILVILLASCVQEVEKAEETSPYAHASAATETKVLTSVDLSAYSTWEFKAEPLFEDDDLYGAVRTWRALSVTDGSADLGYYTPGEWNFSVRAFNSQGQKVGEGQSGGVFLAAGAENTVAITMENSFGEGSGDVYLNASIQTMPGISLAVSYAAVTFEEGAAVVGNPVEAPQRFNRSTGSGRTTWQGYVKDLPSGTYVFYVSVVDSEQETVAGQAIEVKVLPSIRTDIEGTLTPGSFINGSLSISTYNSTEGKIVSDDYDETIGCVVIPENEVRTDLSWEVLAGVSPVSYRWYVDGKRQIGVTTSTFSFAPANGPGEYMVSCVATGRMSGESTSGSVLVRYLP